MSCNIITCDIPLCVTTLTVATIQDHPDETIYVSFKDLATGAIKWVQGETDEEGILTVDISTISSWFTRSKKYEIAAHSASGNECPDFDLFFMLDDGGEVTASVITTGFVKVNTEVETFTLKYKSTMAESCCGPQYVPLSRTLTINGVTYTLREDRTWTIEVDSAVWGNITGDIEDQTDLSTILTDLADDITAEASARATGDTNTLNAANAHADSLVLGLVDDRGGYNANSNLFPSSGGSGTAGAILKGDQWEISAGGGGTLGGIEVDQGDLVRALVNAPGQTASNWYISSYNTQQATESERGTAKIATQAEIENSGTTNDTDIVTPVKWWLGINALFQIGIFFNAVTAATITSLTGDSGPIAVNDTLRVMLSKLQAQINIFNGSALTVTGGIDGTLKQVQNPDGSTTPMRVSDSFVQFPQGIILPTETSGQFVHVVVNDLKNGFVFTDYP